MIAIFKKEIASYFRTMTGYVLIAFLIIFTGIYFMVYNLYQGYPYFSYTLTGVLSMMTVWVPVLTMRSFAEERKLKTDQLILTSPIKLGRIVVGKYLAMVAIFLVPILIYCLFPLIIEASGTAYLLIDYVAILEFFLLGCAFISIGMFFSSITENPMIAAVSTFAVIFLVCVWENLIGYLPQTSNGNIFIVILLSIAVAMWLFYLTKNCFMAILVAGVTTIVMIIIAIIDASWYENLFIDALGDFNLMAAFNNCTYYSVFDVKGTVLPLTVIGVFLFLTIQSIEKRRWS